MPTHSVTLLDANECSGAGWPVVWASIIEVYILPQRLIETRYLWIGRN